MNYSFEHIFIPEITDNSNKSEFDIDNVEIFDDFEFTMGCYTDKFPNNENFLDWDSFSICKEMSYELTYWLLRFPEPKKEPEAKWGLILKKEGKPFVYFTFEKASGNQYALCFYKNKVHCCNNMFAEDTKLEKFIDEACALYEEM